MKAAANASPNLSAKSAVGEGGIDGGLDSNLQGKRKKIVGSQISHDLLCKWLEKKFKNSTIPPFEYYNLI